jgi:hypothetical protein
MEVWSMRTIRPIMIVLGLVLIAGGTAYAATPAEQAAYRAEAKALSEQARGLDQQANTGLGLTGQIYLAEFRKVDALQDQADTRRVLAYQKWIQGAAPKQAQASLYRESARSLQLEAFDFGARAGILDIRAASARSREARFRAAAAALLASGSDAETKAVARDMTQQASAEARDANSLENESASLLRRQVSTKKRADALTAKAMELEASIPNG